MLRPCIIFRDARPPDRAGARTGVRAARAARVAVSGATRLPGAARSGSGPETGRRRERGDDRSDDGGWNQARGVVLGLHRLPPPSTALARPPLVLRER